MKKWGLRAKRERRGRELDLKKYPVTKLGTAQQGSLSDEHGVSLHECPALMLKAGSSHGLL